MVNYYKRRVYQRYLVEDKATLITNDKIEKLVSLKDISAGGVSVITDSLPAVKDRLKLLIDAPNILSKPEIRDANITWCRKLSENSWQVGFSFDKNKLIIPKFFTEGPKKTKVNKRNNLNIITAYILAFVFFSTTIMLSIIVFNGISQTITLQGIAFEPNGKSTAVFVTNGNNLGKVEIERINKDSIEIKINKELKIIKLGQKITFFKNKPFLF